MTRPLDRRSFLRVAGLGIVGGAVASAPGPARRLFGAPAAGSRFGPIGVQLYTVRQALADDVPGTLARLAEIGYEEVETAGLHGVAPAAFRRHLDDHGLRAVSAHVPLEALGPERIDATLAEAETLGARWVTVPWLGDDHRSADGYRRAAEALDRAGEVALRRGMRVAYHNHDFEFEPFEAADGRTGWEILIDATDPDLVDLQMDLYWTVHAGSDPLGWFERHPGRFPMVHAKDRAADGAMVDVGAGVMDFGAILGGGFATGLRHVFVEHDRPANPLESVRASYDTLSTLEI